MNRTKLGRSLEKVLRIIIGVLLIFIGVVFAIKSLLAPTGPELSPLTADGFRTAFTVAENGALAVEAYQRHLLLQVMAPLTAGSIGILYAGALLIYTRIFSLKPSRPISSIAMFAGILILVGAGGLSILKGPDAQHVRDCASLQTLYDAQRYKIAEGVVHITGVLPSCARGAGDSLKIGSTWLDVCYYVSTCEYKLSVVSHNFE